MVVREAFSVENENKPAREKNRERKESLEKREFGVLKNRKESVQTDLNEQREGDMKQGVSNSIRLQSII